jgi:hypothetical protein
MFVFTHTNSHGAHFRLSGIEKEFVKKMYDANDFSIGRNALCVNWLWSFGDRSKRPNTFSVSSKTFSFSFGFQTTFKIIENKLRLFLLSCVLFYIKETTSISMNAISLTTKHCLSFAAIRLQGTSAISSGFMVKYGPNTGLEDRTLEVRG